MSASWASRVLAVVDDLPPGTVATYGEVAAEAGRPGAARAVGAVLRSRGADVAWWRVVTAQGRLVPGREEPHAAALAAEGVRCRHGYVVALNSRARVPMAGERPSVSIARTARDGPARS